MSSMLSSNIMCQWLHLKQLLDAINVVVTYLCNILEEKNKPTVTDSQVLMPSHCFSLIREWQDQNRHFFTVLAV